MPDGSDFTDDRGWIRIHSGGHQVEVVTPGVATAVFYPDSWLPGFLPAFEPAFPHWCYELSDRLSCCLRCLQLASVIFNKES